MATFKKHVCYTSNILAYDNRLEESKFHSSKLMKKLLEDNRCVNKHKSICNCLIPIGSFKIFVM